MSEISDREIIQAMAGGARIRATDHGGFDGYSYELIHNGRAVDPSQLIRLLDQGWIYSSNTAYFLTDEGKKAYLRSTDELGNGKLELP